MPPNRTWRLDYWQHFDPATEAPDAAAWRDRYLARMPDGRRLALPLRDLGATAVAGLIANQAAFDVLDALTAWLADIVRDDAPDVVVGLPTLGHGVAAAVARRLGHPHWVAAGTSRKLWYEERLSVPLASITSPAAGRRLWLDPRLVPRVAGRRVLLVDDVVSTGASIAAALELLARVEVRPVAVGALMTQTERWRDILPSGLAVRAVFATPAFHRTQAGWVPV